MPTNLNQGLGFSRWVWPGLVWFRFDSRRLPSEGRRQGERCLQEKNPKIERAVQGAQGRRVIRRARAWGESTAYWLYLAVPGSSPGPRHRDPCCSLHLSTREGGRVPHQGRGNEPRNDWFSRRRPQGLSDGVASHSRRVRARDTTSPKEKEKKKLHTFRRCSPRYSRVRAWRVRGGQATWHVRRQKNPWELQSRG